MTSSAAYQRQAIAELRAVDARIGNLKLLAPEVLRFTPTLDREAFLRAIQERPPIFIRHLHPVDLTAAPTVEAIAEAVGPLLTSIRPGERIAVQGRRLAGREEALNRPALKEALDQLIERAGGIPVIQAPDRILSVSWDATVAQIGLSTPAENLSDWTGGEARFRREEEQISRARFKLLEAFALFDVRLVEGGEALDLGAAPGGWTSLLLERGMRVTAVDTGEIAPSIRQHPNLTFVQENVERVAFPSDLFDLITCDMSWNPVHTARLVVRLAPSVKAGAHGILTIKLMGDNPTRTIRRVTEHLDGSFEILRVKQFFHNRDEVTVHLRRRA
jgi:23S rRNA (cytidine2498-2'-O)-methyltransferase